METRSKIARQHTNNHPNQTFPLSYDQNTILQKRLQPTAYPLDPFFAALSCMACNMFSETDRQVRHLYLLHLLHLPPVV